ncbi:MAG: phosphoribosylformylglycinamidine cyclo-ligase [Cellvibrionales bacterium TMED49]|nr:phosphoribosylformylglycinamidine cyclo-ligase [Porticoccaceae bacterium]OUU39304.1 MAG: phosphoribosylformylglycinamidine cyclo-ligase [Cellvibrionales bacterium TMED49]
MSDKNESDSYKSSGVDIDAGAQLVEEIKDSVRRTNRFGVLSGLGGFGGLFEMPTSFRQPVLVSSTDGVGTKLKLAITHDKYQNVGIDLVAMCVNDIICSGAEPLFFLDYYATGKLNVPTATSVIKSIANGCERSGCALIGGETAEMPGMYGGTDFDLAGFCVGIVEKSKIIDGSKVSAGDSLLALRSSGPHSNGFSLIRKVIEVRETAIENAYINKTPLIDLLMMPTKIYVKSILNLLKEVSIHGIAHITGGGLLENIPRFLPPNTTAKINCSSWEIPKVFNWIKQEGNLDLREMYRTFNCGIGMVICVSPRDIDRAIMVLKKSGEEPFLIGHVETSNTVEAKVCLERS